MDLPFRLLPLLACFALAGHAAAAAPTLTEISELTGGNEDNAVSISFATLLAASNAQDTDGHAISFRVKSINGEIHRAGNEIEVDDLFNSGQTWSWTPPTNANGTVEAFSVVAVATDGETTTPVKVEVNITPVNDAPVFTKGGDIEVEEDSGAQTRAAWATVTSKGAPDESSQTVEFIIVSNDNPGLFSAGPVVSPNGTLTFTPAPDKNGEANIQLKLRDSDNAESANQSFTIEVTPVPDAPVLGGTFKGTALAPFPDSGEGEAGIPATGDPFSQLTVSDVDGDNQTVTVTISNTAELYGTFSLPNSSVSSNASGKVYTLSNLSPGVAQSRLRAAAFTPSPNVQPVGIYDFAAKVEVRDSTSLTATPIDSSLHVESVNDAPSVAASLAIGTISDGEESSPFRLSVTDVDPGDSFSVTINETSPTQRGNLVPPTTPMTGTAEGVAAAMTAVRFQPLPQSATQIATFAVNVTDVHPSGVSGTPVSRDLSLTITFANDAPQISGTATEVIRTTDDPSIPPVFPFTTVNISDADPGQSLTLTLSLDDPAKGSFSGAFNALGQLTGTAAEITAKLREVSFRPAPGRIPLNQSETVVLTITVNDGTSARSNSLTMIEVTSINGAPAVTWDLANGNVAGNFPLATNPALIDPSPVAKPFARVGIADDGQVVVTLKIDNAAKGELENLNGFVESPTTPGTYIYTGLAEDAQAKIRDIVFVPSESYIFPPNQPGRTDFTISASDSALNLTTRLLPIMLVSDTRNFLVTSLLDDPALPGTLRHAVAHAKNNDVITFALPSYPAVIRLSKTHGPLVLEKHLTLRGPGADKLTLTGDSNSNGSTDTNDVQLFRIFAGVQIKGLRLARGFAITGGAAYVGRLEPDVAAGSLTLEDCVIANCMASQWGGALDVAEGSLTVDRCLFETNSLHPSSGLGGGAVSLYTDATCSFLNSTFSGNSQAAPTGFGGGAIYVENFDPTHLFQTKVTHCTFAGNSDVANKGSAIHSNVSNTRVILSNSIFGDVSARNLQVAGGGEIQSAGGNLSRDNTSTTFIQGGVPQQAVLLNHLTDKRSIDPKLSPLGTLEGQSRGYRLLADSPAVGAAIAGQAVVDQRGVIRNSSADSGAVDANALGKILIHEIFASQTSLAPQFIEFYNPRDQAAVDLSGFEVWVDGLKRHVFAAGHVVRPGFGIILADIPLVPANANTPVVLPSEPALTPNLDLALRGRIELRAPTQDGAKTVEAVSYNGVFVNSSTPADSLDFDLHSLTLAPQFQGAAFVPHGLVQPPPNGGVIMGATGATTSPGADTGGTPFGEANAYPIAVADSFEVTEDELSTLNVLANDLDADGSDELFAVDLNTTLSANPPASNKATLVSSGGAGVTIEPAATPLRGTALGYDPRTAFNSLPAGARVTDTFAYSIVDVGAGAIAAFADGGAGSTIVSAPSHRLAAGEAVVISDAGPAAYNGTHAITLVDGDSFKIAVPFTVNPPVIERGRWQAVEIRTPSARDEALVQVSVLGRNDPPAPVADLVATGEETVLRILADPGTGTALDTDALYPLPRQFATTGILTNDSDPDTNDQPFSKLRVVGVCQVNTITGYSGTAGSSPVTVTAPAHGLTAGATVLISGYGGHTSYNGYHAVTITGADTFTIPVTYVDNATNKGVWAILNDANRLTTTSAHGAAVTLEIRANRAQTNIVYNPRPSTYLDGLANGELATDSFYYAVEDNAGAVSLAKLSVNVTGVNDAPVPSNDPPGLAVFGPLPAGQNLASFAAASDVLYVLPSNGSSGGLNVAIRPPGGASGDVIVIPSVAWTHEDVALPLASTTLLANDSDVDRSDVLRLEIGAGQSLSREGAAISLSPDGSVLTYNPTGAAKLQSLAFKERVIDTFNITVFDGIARVTTAVAVLVEGRNDKPDATNANLTTAEKSLLNVTPPGLLNSGVEIDQNTRLPDNRKFLLPVANANTTVSGAKVNVLLEPRQGSVDGFAAVPGTPGATLVLAANHGLQSGQEVVLPASGALTGQYVLTRIDANSFSVPVAWNATFSSLSGSWRVLASTFQYDPRGSVFPGPTGGPNFTLQGLAQGQTYNDTFTYTLLDGSFLFANDDIYRIEADRSAIELRVLGNDTSLDGVATSRNIISVGPPSAGGTVTINANQSLIYAPEIGFVGDEVFTYTIEDDLGNRDTALVTARVTIDRLNGNLRANADRFTVAAGQSPLLNVLANDSIIPATGDPLTLTAISTAPDKAGTAAIENGQIRYTPSTSAVTFPYTETFAYTMSGGGSTTATAMVTVLVQNRAGTLNVRADSFGVAIGSAQATLNVLENDNILPGNGEALTISSVTAPAHGSVSIVNGAALAYTAPAGFLGNDTFSYTAADGFGGTGTALVTVKVGYLTTNTDIFSVHFDDAAKATDDGLTTLDVLANDHVLQAGNGAVTITGVTPTSVALGQMSITPGGASLSFDPAVGATGQQDFTYTISDVSGRTATGTVTVVVIANGIRASSDFYTVQTDSQQNALPVLANDLRISDLPGDLSVAAIGTGPNAPDQGGTVEISEDFKGLIYTPAQGFSGTETFTCTVTDGDSSDTARVTIRVTTGEMVAGGDEYFSFRGSSANRLAVLDNDRVIPDAGQLLLIQATGIDPANLSNPPHRGTLEIIEGGAALSYTPNPDNAVYPYAETFTYEISSGGSTRAEAVVRIEVLDRVGSRNLETNNDSFAVRSDSGGTLLSVLANDSVLPASAADWIISDVTVPTSNLCSPFVTGDFLDPAALSATLSAQATPLTQFLWARFAPASRSVFSSGSSSEVQRRVALVTEFNSIVKSPASIYDSARFAGITLREETQTLIESGATGEQLIVLNRLLLEDAFTSTLLRQAAGGGSVQIVGANLIYVPQPGFVGSVRFTYRVSDGLGGTGSAEVTVRVGDISVSDDAYTVLAGGGAVALDVTANDGILRIAFPASQQAAQADFTLTPVKAPTVDPVAAGTVAVTGDTVTFTPASNFQGKAAITYWVEDDGGCTYPGIATVTVKPQSDDRDTAVATVTVTGLNDPPQLLNVDPRAVLDTATVQPFANATVVEFDAQRQELVTLTITYPAERGVLGGGFTVVSPGVLRFQGTAAQVTAALRALVFTPVINRIPVGTTENTVFAASMDDGFVSGPVVVNATTTVTPVNDPPVITGTVGGQKVYQFSSLRPFAGVNITDIDNLGVQQQTVTLTQDDAIKGGLSNLGGFVQQPAGGNSYVFTGTPAAAAAALRGLVFTPTPGIRVTPTSPETVFFILSVNDGFAPPLVNTATTVQVLHAEVDKILPLAVNGNDASQSAAGFGSATAISGNTMVIGSPARDNPGSDIGRVHVYERNAGTGLPWGQVAEFASSDSVTGDRFGESVAIDGNLMVIGAPGADASANNAGAAYVFQRDAVNPNAWTQVAKIVPPAFNTGGGDGFGAAVAIDDLTILIGAPNANLPGTARSGRAFMFGSTNGTAWTHRQTLVAADNRGTGSLTDSEFFGGAVTLEDNTAVIGSPGANAAAPNGQWNYGAAYVFTRPTSAGTWSEIKRLDEFTDPDGANYSGFGYAVDLSGDRLALGVYSGGSPIGNFKAGGVRIYERNQGGTNQWGVVQKFTPSSGVASTYFGYSVAISGELLMIGSPGPDSGSADKRGYVEVYRRRSPGTPAWTMIDRFMPSASTTLTDRFGHSLAMSSFSAVVGAAEDGLNPLNATTAGSARAYQFQYDLGPRLIQSVPDQLAQLDTAFQFTASPASFFDDPVYPGALTLSLRLSDGSPLPAGSWLSFNPATGAFTGTPTTANQANYEFVLTATNPLGSVIASNPFRIQVQAAANDLASAYATWTSGKFTSQELGNPALFATVWGMDADPDKDGNANVLEMLFGTNPKQSDHGDLVLTRTSATQASLTFTCSGTYPMDAIHVQWSGDFGTWSGSGVALSSQAIAGGNLKVTAVITLPSARSKVFARINTGP